MGIFIHLNISKSVTKKEWERVYEETLLLAKKLPFAEKRSVKCNGIDTICLTPTEEHEHNYGWNGEKTRIGWNAVGDYETLHTAEDYFLPRDLVADNKVETDAGDALLGSVPSDILGDDDWEYNSVYNLWGNKTQGEPYHMYLLAIACLIEERLGEKAFVYGDITRGQCKKAVELANKHLEEPINIPERCDTERLWKRLGKLPFNERERLTVFDYLYLGTKDAGFGEYIRSICPVHILDEYWKSRFEHSQIGTIGFDEDINEYLLWGFDLEKLCGFVNYNDEGNSPKYEQFIKRILDAKLHLKEKNCEDILAINQEEAVPYSIYTLLAQFVFAGARNKKVDRYIPIDELRESLKNGLGEKCEVDTLIDDYLAKEAEEMEVKDESEVFRQAMNIERMSLTENLKRYSISTYEDLLYYEKGDTMQPELIEALRKSFLFYIDTLKENRYKDLMTLSAKTRCNWLVEQNQIFLLRDKDWDKIFKDIEENGEAFARYYPMMRVELNTDNLLYMVKAIVLNDELYGYCKELVS